VLKSPQGPPDTPDEVDGSITSPDRALNTMTRFAALGLHGSLSGNDLDRLFRVIQWLNAHLLAGGALPTDWAGRPDARDDDARPVTDVPGGGRLRRGWVKLDREILITAALAFTETWAELAPDLPDHYGCTLTCAEADTLCELLRAAGHREAGDAILIAHAYRDEPGDGHYTEPAKEEGP
jgi:hypothetical protein